MNEITPKAVRKPPIKQPGSEKRLYVLTYSQIGRWAGIASRTVQHYAAQGEFDARDIESVLAWVNGRRARRGLPMIGEPGGEETQGEAPARTPAENADFWEPLGPDPKPAGLQTWIEPTTTGYDPLRGEFHE